MSKLFSFIPNFFQAPVIKDVVGGTARTLFHVVYNKAKDAVVNFGVGVLSNLGMRTVNTINNHVLKPINMGVEIENEVISKVGRNREKIKRPQNDIDEDEIRRRRRPRKQNKRS